MAPFDSYQNSASDRLDQKSFGPILRNLIRLYRPKNPSLCPSICITYGSCLPQKTYVEEWLTEGQQIGHNSASAGPIDLCKGSPATSDLRRCIRVQCQSFHLNYYEKCFEFCSAQFAVRSPNCMALYSMSVVVSTKFVCRDWASAFAEDKTQLLFLNNLSNLLKLLWKMFWILFGTVCCYISKLCGYCIVCLLWYLLNWVAGTGPQLLQRKKLDYYFLSNFLDSLRQFIVIPLSLWNSAILCSWNIYANMHTYIYAYLLLLVTYIYYKRLFEFNLFTALLIYAKVWHLTNSTQPCRRRSEHCVI
jgi:hypothetical protein